jgi:putative transcriptional regulator
LLKCGDVRGVRFETLSKIGEFLECQPGNLLACVPDEEE